MIGALSRYADIPISNELGKKFANIVMTQDWHTQHHTSFASSHPGKKPFETMELSYGAQVLWPDHCVQGSEDAMLAEGLDLPCPAHHSQGLSQ